MLASDRNLVLMRWTGCEGAESLLPALDSLFSLSAKGEFPAPITFHLTGLT